MSQHISSDKRAEICLQYLRQIAVNNNREWFHEHRDLYDEARAAFESMVHDLIVRIAAFDPSVQYLTVADCTYRFYRDTRFSPDKSPYKRHFGAYINARGKKSNHGGYYMHLEPEGCLVAGGAYCLPSDVLRAVGRPACRTPEHLRTTGNFPPHRGQRSVPQPVSRTGRNTGENHPQGISQGLPLP